MKDLFEFAVRIAEQAGEITLRYFRTGVKVEAKSDQSPVTIADRMAEEFMRTEIEKRFPDDGILGEEFGEKQGRSGYRWILDPLDGTKTFIRGVPMYGTLIALEYNGEGKIGVIRNPPEKETVAAMEGHGCFFNGTPCRVSTTASLAQSAVVTTALDGVLKHLGEAVVWNMLKETGLQRTWGDCYGYALLATGQIDLMIDPIVNLWDVAPMIPIIREAGGRITDVTGHEGIGIKNVVASNGLLHDAALRMVRAPRRD